MKKNLTKTEGAIFSPLLLTFCLALVTLFSGCNGTEGNEDQGQLKIVATTGIIADALINIVQDSASVVALMGPGVDPHLYKAAQGDLGQLTSADVVFYNGLQLEGKMGEVLEKLERVQPVFAVAEGLDEQRLLQNAAFANSYDPHIWFDVSLWKDAVAYMSEELQRIDTANASYYAENTAEYLDKLDALHEKVKNDIAQIPPSQRVLITAHDAFGYFGEAYNIEVKGLQGISTLSGFGLKDVSDLVNFITERKIKAVFVETSVSEKSLRAVVEGTHQRGFDVKIGGSLYSDAMGQAGTPEGTYIGMVSSNVGKIVGALK